MSSSMFSCTDFAFYMCWAAGDDDGLQEAAPLQAERQGRGGHADGVGGGRPPLPPQPPRH
jgi:hypothetical protein